MFLEGDSSLGECCILYTLASKHLFTKKEHLLIFMLFQSFQNYISKIHSKNQSFAFVNRY